jgi:steroid delta-isomerase-like uncharacterized protein
MDASVSKEDFMPGETIDSAVLEANKAAVRAHYDAMINAFDPDAIRAQVADDFYDHQYGCPMSADAAIAHARVLHAALSDLRVTIEEMIAEGDRVAVRATWRGVHTGVFRGAEPTGKPVTFTGMVFWRLRDGRVVERRAEVDLSHLTKC